MQREDRILEGAFDSHAHIYPEFTVGMPPRVENTEWAHLAARAGMRGFVIKSHIFPTVTTARAVNEAEPGLEIFGGVALNPPAGGLSPMTVEIVAQTGGKVIWMPTWSALQDPPKTSIFRERMKPYISTLETNPEWVPDLGILGADGALLPQVSAIIELCARYGLVLATGHLPIAASLILAEEAAAKGAKVLLTHPLNGAVGASIENQREIVRRGGMIEHVFVGCLPMHHRLDPRQIVESIEAVGAEHCVMASDAIEAWNPPAPELLRMFIATMLALGVDEGAVHAMTHENQERLFGLDARPAAVEA